MNPLHFNEEYAKNTVFRRPHRPRHADDQLSLHRARHQDAGHRRHLLSASVRFKAPVRIGDTVTATCTVREVNMAAAAPMFDCVCKVGETIVVEGEANIMVPSRAA